MGDLNLLQKLVVAMVPFSRISEMFLPLVMFLAFSIYIVKNLVPGVIDFFKTLKNLGRNKDV